MSNVLIGIIGVILFIGLALAGALILGDDFRSARIDSEAVTNVQRVSQLSNAISMFQTRTGRACCATDWSSDLVPRFIRTLPNDASETYALNWVPTSNPRRFAYVVLGGQRASEVCASIQRQSNGDASTVPTVDWTSSSTVVVPDQVGCLLVAPSTHVAYSRF